MSYLFGYSIFIRAAAIAALLMPLMMSIGQFFPRLLKELYGRREERIGMAFFINSLAITMTSVYAVEYLKISGFHTGLYTVAGIYLLLSLLPPMRRKGEGACG